MTYYRDNRPRTLTAWQLRNDSPYGPSPNPANVGTEFAGYDAPKLKFLFTVAFEFSDVLRGSNPESDSMVRNVYPCKNATRPNVTVNYTDVNSYNYRYKVATRTDYGTVTVQFYDDNKNTVHSIFQTYLEEISPVSRKMAADYYTESDIQQWASLGPLPTNAADGLIKSMRVTHHYTSSYYGNTSNYSKIHYDYINPKVQTFNWDELDMSQSDASMISATFVYDSVNITVEHNESLPTGGTVIVNDGNTGDGDAVENIRGS